MSVLRDRRTGVIGAGRLGTALAKAMFLKGYNVVGISARSEASRRRADRAVPRVPILGEEEVARGSDVLLVAVADDAISVVVERLASFTAVRSGQIVAHLSGRYGLEVLRSAAAFRAIPMALHPAMTFAGVASDYTRFDGLPFGVSAPPQSREVAEQVVRDIGGDPIWVPEADRTLYHAALCFGANNLVTLVAAAVEALRASGVKRPAELIRALIIVSAENAIKYGDEALTGPIRRGDHGTISAHLEAFGRAVPDLVDAYRQFGQFTANRAAAAKLNDELAIRRSTEALREL